MNKEDEKRTVIELENKDEKEKMKKERWVIKNEYISEEALISVLYTDAHIYSVSCVADTQYLACYVE